MDNTEPSASKSPLSPIRYGVRRIKGTASPFNANSSRKLVSPMKIDSEVLANLEMTNQKIELNLMQTGLSTSRSDEDRIPLRNQMV